MKKFISAIAAVSMCAVMFAACGDNGAADENLTESLTAEAEADVTENTSAVSEKSGTEADSEDNGDSGEDIVINDDDDNDGGDLMSFDSFDDIDADKIFTVDYEYISAEESNVYSFAETLKGAAELYLDVESTDGSVSVTMALSQDKIALNAFYGDAATEVSVIIKDGMMYMLSAEEKTGFYFAADEDIMAQYDLDSVLEQVNIDKDMELDEIKAAAVLIGGTEYVFEFSGSGGMIFDGGGKLRAMVSKESSNGINTMIVNEFGSTVPDGAFDIPDDYTIVDLETAFTGE